MSRSLGDGECKAVGVIPDPSLSHVTIDAASSTEGDGDLFIIVASDGVWEFIESEEACRIVGAHLGNATEACTALVQEAAARWKRFEGSYRDDITAIVALLPFLEAGWADEDEEEEDGDEVAPLEEGQIFINAGMKGLSKVTAPGAAEGGGQAAGQAAGAGGGTGGRSRRCRAGERVGARRGREERVRVAPALGARRAASLPTHSTRVKWERFTKTQSARGRQATAGALRVRCTTRSTRTGTKKPRTGRTRPPSRHRRPRRPNSPTVVWGDEGVRRVSDGEGDAGAGGRDWHVPAPLFSGRSQGQKDAVRAGRGDGREAVLRVDGRAGGRCAGRGVVCGGRRVRGAGERCVLLGGS